MLSLLLGKEATFAARAKCYTHLERYVGPYNNERHAAFLQARTKAAPLIQFLTQIAQQNPPDKDGWHFEVPTSPSIYIQGNDTHWFGLRYTRKMTDFFTGLKQLWNHGSYNERLSLGIWVNNHGIVIGDYTGRSFGFKTLLKDGSLEDAKRVIYRKIQELNIKQPENAPEALIIH